MKSDQIFITDTSGLIALTILSDSNHERAVAATKRFNAVKATILISSEVFAETMNLLGKRFSHAQATEVASYISSTPLFLFIDSSLELRTDAIERFSTQPGSVSYTDCLVMALADSYTTKAIFGFDTDHARNGYTIISE